MALYTYSNEEEKEINRNHLDLTHRKRTSHCLKNTIVLSFNFYVFQEAVLRWMKAILWIHLANLGLNTVMLLLVSLHMYCTVYVFREKIEFLPSSFSKLQIHVEYDPCKFQRSKVIINNNNNNNNNNNIIIIIVIMMMIIIIIIIFNNNNNNNNNINNNNNNDNNNNIFIVLIHLYITVQSTSQ